jgi:hypothetical protein
MLILGRWEKEDCFLENSPDIEAHTLSGLSSNQQIELFSKGTRRYFRLTAPDLQILFFVARHFSG